MATASTAPAHTAGASDLIPAILDALRRAAPPGELDGLDEAGERRLAEAALSAMSARNGPAAAVEVSAGDGEAGARRMTVALNIGDRPFLVDSATAAVSGAGLAIHRLLHPVVAVQRDAAGRPVALGPDAPNAPRESLIVMEVERAPAKARAALQLKLAQTFADVAAATDDWTAMLARLRAAARDLNDNPPPMPPHVLAETIAFLEWLAADNFTLLGSRDDAATLGLFRDAARFPAPAAPAGDAALAIAKSPLRSTVHRTAPLDVVSVRRFDGQGRPAGVAHFAGLFTSAALNESPRRVPLVRRKVAEVTERLGFDPRGHAGKTLAHVIETFPREELFQVDADRLMTMACGLLSLLDRPRPRLFARADAAAATLSALAYIPREAYSAELRQRVGAMLEAETGGQVGRFDVELRAEGLARVHYVLDGVANAPDEAALDAALQRLVRGWEEALEAALADAAGPARAARLALSHGRAFSAAYRAEFTPAEAAADILRLTELSSPADRDVLLYRRAADAPNVLRLKIYRLQQIIPLSEAVPVLENFGFRVIEEFPFDLAGGELGWVHDFRLELPEPPADFAAFERLLAPALDAVFTGSQENDAFNALITLAGLSAEEANWLRAWFRYLRQIGVSYGMQTVVDALRRHAPATRAVLARFRADHAPAGGDAPTPDSSAADADFARALDAVAAIDDDRILRLFHGLVAATLRTNAFTHPDALAFKLDSRAVPGLPKPLPWREIWVYSPRVEGIHLRGGPIARGGLRWSDRRDDFRTEVLGLVKAQMVKNAVIVPTGAKGGFYPKQLPPATDRDAWLKEGTESYKVFIRALLSITDNLDAQGEVVPPAGVVRRDADDPYLVVAADKGTATFSDTANALAERHGFWLGDAFASGGSAGYDHKGMGITARGAWVSVQRHFAERGVDVQSDPITVAGVGDMSGDVFGNGLLLSRAVKLVAAFDHRHIFLDPSPDPAAGFAERERLFALPRSSWADYDAAKISAGGGVFPRTQKAIPLTPQVQAVLGLSADTATPSELIAAILTARVDLLWFGGIGTYVKAASESHAEVGDRANDAHRVDAERLRCVAIGEGANLGMTQAARVAFSQAGGRVNTDFIDNSAGVDTSDHEVNIKIALGADEAAGRLDRAARDALLAAMTDDVAGLVLADNRAQTLAISVAESRAAASLDAHVRLMNTLAASGRLDPAVEGLPTAQELAERKRLGRGLTRPELAVLLAYAKMDLKDALVASGVVDDPLLEADLIAAFPAAMRDAHRDAILRHRLRRELIATKLANLLVNRGGLTMAHGLAAELGVDLPRVAAAFVSARALFDLPDLWAAIDAAGVAAGAALSLHAQAAGATATLLGDLARRRDADRPSALVARLSAGIGRITARLDELLRPEPRAQVERVRAELAAVGAPAAVTDRLCRLHALSGAAGIAALAGDLRLDEGRAAEAYTRLGERLGLDWARGAVGSLSPGDDWERLLAASLTRGFETMRLDLVRRVTPDGGDPLAAADGWLAAHAAQADALARAIASARAGSPPTLAMLAHLAGVANQALAA